MKSRLWQRYKAAFPDPEERSWKTKAEFYRGYYEALDSMRSFLSIRVGLANVFG